LKGDFHAEIQALETAIQAGNAPSQNQSFQRISYISTATATSPFGERLKRVVRAAREVAELALDLAEYFAGAV